MELELDGRASLKDGCVMETMTVEILMMKRLILVVSSYIHK